MVSSQALEALQQAATGWRRREVLADADPLAVERSRLLAWLEERHDLGEPVAFDPLPPRDVLAHPFPAGAPVLLAGDPDPWFVRMPRWSSSAFPQRWLPLEPTEAHLSRQSPQALLWHDDRAERRHRCGAAALLRIAADGEAAALTRILERRGLPAAAALVRRHADSDGLYEIASGGVPRELPSPRRLLRAAFADRPEELIWLAELAAPADWSSGPGGLEVPRGEARLPQQPSIPPPWLKML